VVGAKDERHGVEEEDGRLGLVRHETEFNSGKERENRKADRRMGD
jgi:hypothetical protein